MAWDVVYYKAPDGSVPAVDFLDGCPTKVAANLLAVLDAVSEAPPPQYSGGGKWEAMHGTMGGNHAVRARGPGREQFRLFCLLENADPAELRKRGLPGAGDRGDDRAVQAVADSLQRTRLPDRPRARR